MNKILNTIKILAQYTFYLHCCYREDFFFFGFVLKGEKKGKMCVINSNLVLSYDVKSN